MLVMPVLAIGFIAPWIMGGAAAATSVPIIIHLLNKRRFKIMFWAAMDFLLAAHRRNGGALLDKPTPDKVVIAKLLKEMPASDGGTDLHGALAKATKIVQETRAAGGTAEVLLLTDLSYSSIAYGRPNGNQVKENLQKAS